MKIIVPFMAAAVALSIAAPATSAPATAAVVFATNPATEMPMMKATMEIAACERFVSEDVNGKPDVLDVNKWAPADRELVTFAIQQGHKIAPSMKHAACSLMLTKAQVEIMALAQGL
ncbi:MAG: hypothetical protein JWO65_2255 [Sphingomonas bacterium]|nr:hypothetical protein [Sphingomonas bacterium]